jgi:hypothetical protein
MADFCYDCTFETFGSDVADRNDMRGCGYTWALCEGCGHHIFDDEGVRFCDSEAVAYELCEACIARDDEE